MERHRIDIKPIAEADMLSCIDYTTSQLKNPMAALRLLDEIDRRYGLLENNPFMGTEYITQAGRLYRFLIIGRYKMFYTVKNNAITIQRFLYAPSDFGGKLDEGGA